MKAGVASADGAWSSTSRAGRRRPPLPEGLADRGAGRVAAVHAAVRRIPSRSTWAAAASFQSSTASLDTTAPRPRAHSSSSASMAEAIPRRRHSGRTRAPCNQSSSSESIRPAPMATASSASSTATISRTLGSASQATKASAT